MKYIKYVIILLVSGIVVLSLLYGLYQEGYKKFYAFENSRLKEMIKGSTNYDIIFIGASRTYYHVNPAVIDSITHKCSFNLGFEGCNLLEMNLALQTYVKAHKAPEMVVVDVPMLGFAVNRQPFFNPNIYYPYLDQPIIYNALKPYKRVFMLKHFPFLRFMETDDMLRQNAVLGFLGKKNTDNRTHYKGFITFGTDTVSLPLIRRYTFVYEIDQIGINLLNKIITTCKTNNIKIVLTYAPEYHYWDESINKNFFPTLQKIAAEQNIPFWDYRKEQLCHDHTLFIDEHHLNEKGANLYSRILANDLAKTL